MVRGLHLLCMVPIIVVTNALTVIAEDKGAAAATREDFVRVVTLTQDQLKQAASDEGIHLPWPADTDRETGGIGLFIGINTYDLPKAPKLQGCVNDAVRMYTLFTTQFGIGQASLITNRKAALAGVTAALMELADRVKAQHQRTGRPVPVVITFAGHGSQLPTDNGQDVQIRERDGLDETWVAADENLDDRGLLFGRQLRDDHINALCTLIIRRGGHLILISDSCHSGTIHRAGDLGRRLPPDTRLKLSPQRPGPLVSLDDWLSREKVRGAPVTGFTKYSACRDDELALETVDENRSPRGRFSYAMGLVLQQAGPTTTYAQVQQRLTAKFAELGYANHQTPTFHSSSSKPGELFMQAIPETPCARIISRSSGGNTAVLDMGSLHGVEPSSVFFLYRNVTDLSEDRNRIGSAWVKSVGAVSCEIEFKPRLAVEARDLVGRLDSVRFRDFRVHLAQDLPSAVTDRIKGLDERKQLTIVTDPALADAVLLPAEDYVGLFPAGEVQSLRKRPKEMLEAIRAVPSRSIEEMVVEVLLSRARCHRLLSLSHAENRLEVSIEPVVRDDVVKGSWRLAPRAMVDGVMRLKHDERFVFRIRNLSREKCHLYVLGLDHQGRMHLFYPLPEEENEPLVAGAQRVLDLRSPFKVSISKASQPATAAAALKDLPLRERIVVKVIASTSPLAIHRLVSQPTAGRSGEDIVRGSPNPLDLLLADLLHGGAATRSGIDRGAVKFDWSVIGCALDVEP